MESKIGYFILFVVCGYCSVCDGQRGSNSKDTIIVRPCSITIAQVNKEYQNVVNAEAAIVYQFPFEKQDFIDPFNTNIRLEVSTDSRTSLECPILFAIGQKQHMSSLQVPYSMDQEASTFSTSFLHTSAGKTLCTQYKNAVPEARNITVRVSTCSRTNVSFSLSLTMKTDFVLPLDQEVTVEVTPAGSKFFGFRFSRPDVSLVRLKVTSKDSTCMTISVQPPYCPVFDHEDNVRYEGLWQTMSTTAAMTLEKIRRFEQGFIVVLVAHHDGKECEKVEYSSSSNTRALTTEVKKQVTILITNESRISSGIYFLCMILPVIVTLLIIFGVTLLFMNRHHWIRQEAAEIFTSDNLSGLVNSVKRNKTEPTSPFGNLQTIEEFILDDLGNLEDLTEEEQLRETLRRRDSAMMIAPVEDYRNRRSLERGENSSSNWRWKANLFMADFKRKEYLDAKKSSKRFYWSVVIVAIFYSIPVYQLIIHYLRVLFRTGEYDICYYNYLCAHRLGMFIDFNHFWSNVSYIIFGFSFIFLVSRRASNLKFTKMKRKIKVEEEEEGCCVQNCNRDGECCWGFAKIQGRWDYGVPQNYGVFYALGLALAMEGVLSAAYHLCPNQSSFQFDTCFMYVIAVLIILKIYQFRHPIHFGANQTFTILAGFVIISVFGLMFEFHDQKAKIVYRWCFITFQFICMIILTVYYYSIGFIKEEDNTITKTWSIFTKLGQLRDQPFHGDRLILPGIMFTVSIAVLIYCELKQQDFATYLLYFLVAMVLVFILYYVGIMKPVHGEFMNRTWVQPVIYFAAAGVIGGFAVVYFVQSPSAWEKSASASREENEECMKAYFPFHPFYDAHDVWHFFSAASLFLIFMGLLIVDDDMLTTPQTRIPVF